MKTLHAKIFHILFIVILTFGTVFITTPQEITHAEREELIDFGKTVTFKGSTNITIEKGVTFYLEWNLDPKVTCTKEKGYDSYSIKFDFTKGKNFINSKYIGVKTENPFRIEIEPIFEYNHPIDDNVKRTTLNSDPDTTYLRVEEYLALTGYGNENIGGYGLEGYLPVFQNTLEENNLSSHTNTEIRIYDKKYAKKIMRDFAGWIIAPSSYTNISNPDEVSKIYGYVDENWYSINSGESLSKYLLIDPLTSGRYEGEIDPDDYVFSYQPQFKCDPVDLRIGSDIDELFTEQNYDSMKAFCTVMAATENGKTKEWLEKIGFKDVFRRTATDAAPIFHMSDSQSYWIGHKKMANDKDLVFIFFEGTSGFEQWVSDVNAYSPTRTDSDGFHDGFYQAEKLCKEQIEKSYIDTYINNPNEVFYSISGYSRGGAIANLLAAEYKINGVELTNENCLSYTFGTPNTRWKQSQYSNSWITNIVDGDDWLTSLPNHWTKHGIVLGYDYDRSVLQTFYSSDSLNLRNTSDSTKFTVGRGHVAENYIARVFTSEPNKQWDTSKWRWSYIHCPTDITILKDGKTVANVVDNVVTSDDLNIGIFVNEAGEKDIITPYDEKYQVIVEATSDGAMDVALNILGGDETAKINEQVNYNITKGETYEVDQETGEVKPLSEISKDKKASLSGFTVFLICFIIISIAIIVLIQKRYIRKKTSNFQK